MADYILALNRNQEHHVKPLEGEIPWPIEYTEDWDPQRIINDKPLLLLVMTDEHYELSRCVRNAGELGIPTLCIIDGIMEWRSIWEWPRFGAGGKPLARQQYISDKIACIGRQSVRLLESWGAVGKCEVVGCPRFDHYLEARGDFKDRAARSPKRLLVATAKTPGFTPEQVEVTRKSLLDLKAELALRKDIEPIWRVTKGMDKDLEVDSEVNDFTGKELYEVLREVDAVITTPSTLMLESMLLRLPTALLDYHNRPRYVSASWTISAREHINQILQEIFDPPANRMDYQEYLLHDCLECYTEALPRLVKLVEKLVEVRRRRLAGEKVEIPARILPLEFSGYTLPSEYFDLSKLYPNHPVFSNMDRFDLQVRLTQAEQEIAAMRNKLAKNGLQGAMLRMARRMRSRLGKS